MEGRKKSKPVQGHKCRGIHHGIVVRCECGWRSEVWFGNGASASAYSEFDSHKEKHREAQQVK
jgi:hypothetical protein